MININSGLVGEGVTLFIETIEYAYPESRLILRYDVGKGEKIHYMFSGFTPKGQRYMRSKRPIADAAKKTIERLVADNIVFIS